MDGPLDKIRKQLEKEAMERIRPLEQKMDELIRLQTRTNEILQEILTKLGRLI